MLLPQLSRRLTTVLLVVVLVLSLSSIITFINNTSPTPLYPSTTRSLHHWITSSLGFTPRNLTAELLRVDSARWRQLLEDERIASKFYTAKDIEQYAGFDGKFTEVDKLVRQNMLVFTQDKGDL